MRTETTSRTLYRFAELSDAAKEAACDWFRVDGIHDDWYEHVYEDAERVAALIGVSFDEKRVPLMSGSTRGAPMIWFSGFSSQGDGACFGGAYAYAKGAPKAVRGYAPLDTELHAIADELQALQRPNFYRLEASCVHAGHYYHSGCMSVSVGLADSGFCDGAADTEAAVTGLMRRFADWIYARLSQEYDHHTSDATVQENIEAND